MVFDYFQMQAMLSGSCRRFLSGVALIHIRNLHILSGGFLHRLGKLTNLRPILLISRCHF